MQKLLSLSLISLLILSSCGTSTTDIPEDTRAEFIIQTLKLTGATGSYQVEKSARLTAGSSLSLPSDGVGQVEEILVKEGQSVKK